MDRRILAELQKAGRLTHAELGERVGLSTTPVWRRVKRLEDAGVIRGYEAVVDPTSVGLHETIFVNVTVQSHSRELQDAFAAAVAEIPEVLSAHFVSGDSDFLLRIAAGGTDHYHSLLIERLYRLPGVQYVRSTFALRTIKDERRVAV